jgi:hypothetical protein
VDADIRLMRPAATLKTVFNCYSVENVLAVAHWVIFFRQSVLPFEVIFVPSVLRGQKLGPD